MDIDRRRLIAISALTGAVPIASLATPAAAGPLSTLGVDATHAGRARRRRRRTDQHAPGGDRPDRGRARAAGARPRRISRRRAPAAGGTQLIGVRGATRLVFTGGSSMIAARGADHMTLSGLVLDGAGQAAA